MNDDECICGPIQREVKSGCTRHGRPVLTAKVDAAVGQFRTALEALRAGGADPRSLAVATTQLETAAMWAHRAIQEA